MGGLMSMRYPKWVIDEQKEFAKKYNEKIDFQNFILYTLGTLSIISSWVAFTFLHWSLVEFGLLIMLGVLFFSLGGYHYLRTNTTESNTQ